MCNLCCGATTTGLGAVLVLLVTVGGYGFLPGLIQDGIINEVVLLDDSIQLERFEELPFPLDFKVFLFNISNAAEVLAGEAQPQLQELGPYVYKLYRKRLVEAMDEATISYRMLDHYEFDAEDSFPFTEDDFVTIANTPYNAILQSAEALNPALMPVLNLAAGGIFGQYNSPIISVRVRELAFEGVRLCENPGLLGLIACEQIRQISDDSPNLADVNGTFQFTLFGYRTVPSSLFVVSRGLQENAHKDLGQLIEWGNMTSLSYWLEEPDVCNMLNGTDSGIFMPFLSRDQSIFAFNPDICRSVEMRYQYDTFYDGIDIYRFAINDWLLDNNEGCFCLQKTVGVLTEQGCLLPGAMELNSCVGAPLVLSYPHFLFADQYRSGVEGLSPDLESHRIFIDLEPNTGTVVRGAKRAQFNVFLRPISGISATQNLRTTLTPMFWIEESMTLPEELAAEVRSGLHLPFTVLRIAVPVAVAATCLILLMGIVCLLRARRKPTIA